MSITNKQLNTYIKNLGEQVEYDFKRLTEGQIPAVTGYLYANLTNVGKEAGETFGGGFRAETLEVNDESQLVFGTGIAIHDAPIELNDDGNAKWKDKDKLYTYSGTVSSIPQTINHTVIAGGNVYSQSLSATTTNKSPTDFNILLSGGDGEAEYPHYVVAAASPEGIMNVIDAVDKKKGPFDEWRYDAQSALSEIQFKPLEGIDFEPSKERAKEIMADAISPLDLSQKE